MSVKNILFSDIIMAFADFITALENADEHDFKHAKKFCSDVLKNMEQGQKTIFGVQEV